MTAWRSPSTSREVASDRPPAPPAPWRSNPWLFAGVGALVGLVVGLLLGGGTGLPGLVEDEPSTRSPLAVGMVTDTVAESSGASDFELPVFNATAASVDATLVEVEGANWTVTSETAEDLGAGTWGTIHFSVAANCDTAGPGTMESVRVRVRTVDGTSVTVLPLPGRGLALRDYHQAVCDSEDPVPARTLAGVWIVEDAYGEGWVAETDLMRFNPDGSFLADDEGNLDTDEVEVRGRYRLEGDLLTIDVTGAFADCVAPSTATWRVTLRDEEMFMVWVRGVCPSGEPGDALAVRRVLNGDRPAG